MLIWTDFISGVTCLIGLILLQSKYLYIVLITGNIILALLHTYNLPIYNSIIKDAITDDYIEKHISLFSIFKEVTNVIAPLVGLVIWKYLGLHFAYIFNAITFFISAYISKGIKTIAMEKYIQKGEDTKTFSEIKSGLSYVLNNTIVRNLLIISSGVNFFLSAYNLLLPYLSHYYAGDFNNFYGIALTLESFGAIIFSLINTKYTSNNLKISHFKMIFSLLFLGFSLLLIPIINVYVSNWFIILPYFFVGGFLSFYNINFFSIVQKTTKSNYIGRVYSVIFTISLLFMPFGNLMFGLLLDTTNLSGMAISGIGIILIAVFYIIIVNLNIDFNFR